MQGKCWFPAEVVSTADPMGLYYLKKTGKAPEAVLCVSTGPIAVVASIITDTPMMCAFDKNPIEIIETGDHVKVDADKGVVTVIKR